MAKNDLKDLIRKLDRIENHLAEEIAPEVNKLLKESVRFSLIDWYNDYDPRVYKRTYNFMKILDGTETKGHGNLITMTVDSSFMDDYKGFEIPPYPTYKPTTLKASTAFDYMFINGEHGHGRWLMHKSVPPFLVVDEDIQDGFGGRINKIIDKTIEKILK